MTDESEILAKDVDVHATIPTMIASLVVVRKILLIENMELEDAQTIRNEAATINSSIQVTMLTVPTISSNNTSKIFVERTRKHTTNGTRSTMEFHSNSNKHSSYIQLWTISVVRYGLATLRVTRKTGK